MKQNNHQFMRAMLFIAILFTTFLGAAASAPGLLTDAGQPVSTKPSINPIEGVGKYTVRVNGISGSMFYYRVNSGEWARYKKPIVLDEYGSYTIEAYAVYYDHAPSDIVSKTLVVDENTGSTLVDPDADNPSIIFHDGFKYRINGSTLSLTGQNDAMCSGDLVIPPSITHNGVTYPVTEVEAWSCYSTHNITSVQIPSTVTEIGLYAFNDCPKLRSITVDPDNPNYCDRDGVLYDKNEIYLYCYPNARATEYTIPDGVTLIYFSAFQEDFDLEHVYIPNTVTSIRTSAFSGCESLKSIVLPNSLRVFGAGAFSSCQELKSVVLPTNNYIKKLPEECFAGCSSLESIEIPANMKTVGDWAFDDCSSLRSVTMSEGVTTIMQYAFRECRSLPEITIPSTVTTIGESPFYRCTSLVDIHVNPANTKYCDVDGVLYDKSLTTLVSYPLANPRQSYDILPTTQVICAHAFDSSQLLEHVNIPSGVTTLEAYAFMYSAKIKSVFVPNTVTTMKEGVFSHCKNLTSATFEAGLKVLGDNTFWVCDSLREVSLGEGLTTIEEGAFRNCRALPKLTLPNSVTSIGPRAFYDCQSLASINIPAGVTVIPDNMLESCNSLTEITIPAGVTSIGSRALSGTSLRMVNCLAETPPTADSNSFYSNTCSKGTLCVPPASLEAYKSAPVWSNFVNTKGIMAGDANGDGALTINDVTSVIDYLLNGNSGQYFSVNADVNGDGKLSILDAAMLIEWLLEMN